MSLALREDCQVFLDKLGLDMLHVEVHSKVLNIVGECGQSLVAISGIQTNSSLTTKEVKYAVSLFEKFLIKYGSKIQELIKEKKALSLLSKPKLFGEYSCDTEGYTAEGTSYYYVLPEYNVYTPKTDFRVKKEVIHPDKLIYQFKKQSISSIQTKVNLILDNEVETVKAFEQLNDYIMLEHKISKLRGEVASCKI